MKVLLTTLGTRGDLNPFLAIGAALGRRGHGVTMLVNPAYEAEVDRCGLDYRGLGEPWEPRQIAAQPELMHPLRGTAAVLDMIVTNAERMLDDTLAAVDDVGPDLLLAHHICLTAPWAAEARGVPWAMASTAPASWPSIEEFCIYPGMPDRDRFPRWALRGGHALAGFLVRRGADRPLNRLRRARGMPPLRNILLEGMFAGRANLGLWSRAYRPLAGDDAPRSHVVGFTWMDGPPPDAALAERHRTFVESGDAPIVFTLGTSAVHVAGRFYEAAADACRILGRRGLLLTGGTRKPRPGGGDALLELPYLPHALAFGSCCATVHHGGMGTTAQALRCGRPMVIVPHAHDQFDNAARCRRLGVSTTVKRRRVSADGLVAALSRVLDDQGTSARARAIAAQLAEEDGAERAADVLESNAMPVAAAG